MSTSSSSSLSDISEIIETESSSSGDNIFVEANGCIPDCSGVYIVNGTGGNKPIYQSINNLFMICWKDTFQRWELIEFSTARYWARYNIDVLGEFVPHGSSQGNPIVRKNN